MMNGQSKDEVAQRLAARHYSIETGITQIFRVNSPGEIESSAAEPIKLLEVSTTTPSTGIMPLGFGPAPTSGIPYPSVIIEVSPDEFDRIKAHDLQLPEGWTIGEELPRPVQSVEHL